MSPISKACQNRAGSKTSVYQATTEAEYVQLVRQDLRSEPSGQGPLLMDSQISSSRQRVPLLKRESVFNGFQQDREVIFQIHCSVELFRGWHLTVPSYIHGFCRVVSASRK